MKLTGIRWTMAYLAIAALAAPAAFAQQQPATSDQYQGVSQPPQDDLIVATPDTPPPTPVVRPKPSPATPATSSTIAARPPAASDAPVITTGPSGDTSHWDNTDYGIVTTPVPFGEDDPQLPPDTTVLHVRDNSSRFASRAAGPSNELPIGAQIRIRIDETLSTSDTPLDAPFHGKVLVNVMQNGSVIIPAGSTLRGRVVQVSQGHHFGPAASLRLRPDMVVLPDGTAYHLYAQVAQSSADDTQVGDEGTIRPDSHAVKKSVEYGAGVGTGAIVGAAVAGPPGALAGTIVGAGLVTTHLLLQHPEAADVPAGSEITFSLTEPLDLIPTRN